MQVMDWTKARRYMTARRWLMLMLENMPPVWMLNKIKHEGLNAKEVA